MGLVLYAHPFASYCQKALIALYENAIPFDYRMLVPEAPENFQRLTELWPLAKFPLLVDVGTVIPEATIIIEHLAVRHPGPVSLVPAESDAALEARLMDRVFEQLRDGADDRDRPGRPSGQPGPKSTDRRRRPQTPRYKLSLARPPRG